MNRRHLLAPDLEAAFALNEEYLGASRDEFFCHYRKNADLFVGIFANSALVGICYGMNWDEKPGCVVLKRYCHTTIPLAVRRWQPAHKIF